MLSQALIEIEKVCNRVSGEVLWLAQEGFRLGGKSWLVQIVQWFKQNNAHFLKKA